jgi:hypothetical protein
VCVFAHVWLLRACVSVRARVCVFVCVCVRVRVRVLNVSECFRQRLHTCLLPAQRSRQRRGRRKQTDHSSLCRCGSRRGPGLRRSAPSICTLFQTSRRTALRKECEGNGVDEERRRNKKKGRRRNKMTGRRRNKTREGEETRRGEGEGTSRGEEEEMRARRRIASTRAREEQQNNNSNNSNSNNSNNNKDRRSLNISSPWVWPRSPPGLSRKNAFFVFTLLFTTPWKTHKLSQHPHPPHPPTPLTSALRSTRKDKDGSRKTGAFASAGMFSQGRCCKPRPRIRHSGWRPTAVVTRNGSTAATQKHVSGTLAPIHLRNTHTPLCSDSQIFATAFSSGIGSELTIV